jgi:hypothetical protein
MGVIRLGVCIGGVYAAFLLWAIAQERCEYSSHTEHLASSSYSIHPFPFYFYASQPNGATDIQSLDALDNTQRRSLPLASVSQLRTSTCVLPLRSFLSPPDILAIRRACPGRMEPCSGARQPKTCLVGPLPYKREEIINNFLVEVLRLRCRKRSVFQACLAERLCVPPDVDAC